MSAIYLKGGVPRQVNGVVVLNTVERWRIPEGTSNHFLFKNSGANTIVLSFTAADAAAGVGWTVTASQTLELPAEVRDFWTKSALGSSFEALVLLRRG